MPFFFLKSKAPVPPTPPTPAVISAGMVCYYDGSKFDFCAASEYSSSMGELQGVVVVPNNHTPDGTVRIIAANGVNVDGTSGSTETEMEWGHVLNDAGLPNLNKVPIWDNITPGNLSAGSSGYLPTNYDTSGAVCTTDPNSYYAQSSNMIPSPYLLDGSLNPDYVNTTDVSGNMLSDFNGTSNTSVLIGLPTQYKPAVACHLYGTAALSAGNWYLPGCGELAYLIPRFNEINTALQTIGGVQVLYHYWSSTEFGSSGVQGLIYACYVSVFIPNSYLVSANAANKKHYVRPFASIPLA